MFKNNHMHMSIFPSNTETLTSVHGSGYPELPEWYLFTEMELQLPKWHCKCQNGTWFVEIQMLCLCSAYNLYTFCVYIHVYYTCTNFKSNTSHGLLIHYSWIIFLTSYRIIPIYLKMSHQVDKHTSISKHALKATVVLSKLLQTAFQHWC